MMFAAPAKLSRKIVGILFGFFLIALSAIVLTLLISWQLEGVAAAINDAGSQRMRTYRISHLMARAVQEVGGGQRMAGLMAEMHRFDKVLADLRSGDPARPMAPPRNDQVETQLQSVELAWREQLRPLVEAYLSSLPAERLVQLDRFDSELEGFVSLINDLVLVMEHSYADDTNLLRSVQVALVIFAIIGTAILIRFFDTLVIQPIVTLHASMRRMMDNDLSVRLPVTCDDEVGDLARGFNQMAEHLQSVYSTLEERVASETRNLAERNHELGILYLTTAYLSEPAPIEVLCRGFLERIQEALGADAAAVRLYSAQTGLLHLVSHEGLSDDFVANEQDLNCGECLCGQVIQTGVLAAFATKNPPPGMKLRSCIREGFATATAFTIMHDKNRLGVYNLYFRRPQGLTKREEHLLETLGQHLGVAIENLRLKSREKELAVSEERNLLAQELHDSIAQSLAFMNIQVQLLEDSLVKGKIEEAMQTAGMLREGVQESYDDVRELLVHFRTRMHQADLDSAIQAALDKFEGQTGVATAFESQGADGPLVSTDEIQIMHIVQEALSNIRKHSGASQVKVLLKRRNGQTIVEVVDNGRGFDPVNEPNVLSDGHVGLKIMRERAYRVGGECRVESEVGAGTRVTLTMPREQERSN